MNVAPDVYAKGSWVVHLYAEAGDEHIYQLRAVSATNAARIALECYEADQREKAELITNDMVKASVARWNVEFPNGFIVDNISGTPALISDQKWR
jgi:hypothetical protein